MATPTEFFRWWIVDERTGKCRLTRYAMTRTEAAERLTAEPDPRTREVRHMPNRGELRSNVKPPASQQSK